MLFRSTVVNRFRGDAAHFADGVHILEKITGLPVAGVVPYIPFDLPEEDTVYNSESAFYSSSDNYDGQFDLIAGHVRKSLDMDLVYKILNSGM